MNNKIKIKQCNYFKFDHAAVNKKFSGDLIYLGDACLKTGQPVAVYKAASPDKSKGHKDIMLLQAFSNGGAVSGMEIKQFKKHASHRAILCTECHTVLYSVHRHHYHTCGCKNDAMVDGGKEYFRYGAMNLKKTEFGTYNILTNKFRKAKK